MKITFGSRLLAPGGRIWTVRSVTHRLGRIVVVSASADGVRGMVIDVAALLRMVNIQGVDPRSALEELLASGTTTVTSSARMDATREGGCARVDG